MKLHEKDKKILQELINDSSQSTKKIASKLNLPISTVHRRKKEMEKTGIIKRYRAEVDMNKFGLPIGIFILINGKEGYEINKIKTRIKSIENVHNIWQVKSGEWDFLIEIYAESMTKASKIIDLIKSTKGIQEISVLFIVDKNW